MKKLTRVLAITATVVALGTAGLSTANAKPDASDSTAQTAKPHRGGNGGERNRIRPQRPEFDGKRVAPADETGEQNADRPNRPGRPGRGPGGGPEGPGGPLRDLIKFWENEELASTLNLTPEQIASLNESYDLTKASLESSEGSIMNAGEELHDAMEVDSPNLDTVNAAIDKLTAASNEKMKVVTAHHVVVKNVLNAEQESALKNFRRDHRPELGEGGPIRDRVRDGIGKLAELVGPMLEDGSIDGTEQAEIDAALGELPEGVQKVAKRIIARWVKEGHVPPPRHEGPGGPDGPRRRPGGPDGPEGPGGLPDLPV